MSPNSLLKSFGQVIYSFAKVSRSFGCFTKSFSKVVKWSGCLSKPLTKVCRSFGCLSKPLLKVCKSFGYFARSFDRLFQSLERLIKWLKCFEKSPAKFVLTVKSGVNRSERTTQLSEHIHISYGRQVWAPDGTVNFGLSIRNDKNVRLPNF